MSKQLLVFGHKTFKITIPDGAKVTFGPWSPPTGQSRYDGSDKALSGTLRVYAPEGKSTENIIAVFSGVKGFRDLSLGYAEEVAREEGATIWKSDEHGYEREEKARSKREWIVPQIGTEDNEEGVDQEDEVDDIPF